MVWYGGHRSASDAQDIVCRDAHEPIKNSYNYVQYHQRENLTLSGLTLTMISICQYTTVYVPVCNIREQNKEKVNN